ncbi:unnamed protein product [Rotaria sp. Silwood2]|nr:unnamed protein product [Rotaria sp. Silwood2]CAF4581612.1 unnamed protein product [Rotaria sp. Silwood2]
MSDELVAEIATVFEQCMNSKNEDLKKQFAMKGIERLKFLKELRAIKDTVIVPADNGGRIVILNKDDYISKMKEKLKDTTIYTEVTDPTNNIQSVSSSFTQKLFQQYKITQGQ